MSQKIQTKSRRCDLRLWVCGSACVRIGLSGEGGYVPANSDGLGQRYFLTHPSD